MNKAKNSTEVLKAAKWILENVGWTKGQSRLTNDAGKYIAFCAYGAVGMVEADNYIDRDLAMKRLHDVAPGGDMVVFNDYKKTTKKMVLNKFDKAIKGTK
jgi:hypothetical protein